MSSFSVSLTAVLDDIGLSDEEEEEEDQEEKEGMLVRCTC